MDDPDDDWTPPELRANFKAGVPLDPEQRRRELFWMHFDAGKRQQEAVYAEARRDHEAWKARREAERR